MTSNWQRLYSVASQLASQLGLPAPAPSVRGDAVTRAEIRAGELAAFFELVLERLSGPTLPHKRGRRRKVEPVPEEPADDDGRQWGGAGEPVQP